MPTFTLFVFCGAALATFGSVLTKPDLPEGMAFPFQPPVVIHDRVYVVREQTVFEYDSARGSWLDRKAPLPLKRHHFGVAAAGGTVYAIGGCTGEKETDPHNPVQNVDAFDPATGKWTPRANLPEPRRNLAAVTVEGRIFVIGGSDSGTQPKPVLVYDPVKDAWSARKAISNVTGCWGAQVINGKIYALGMKNEKDPAAYPFRTDEYDLAADTITSRRPIKSPRTGHATAAANGKLYVIGGVGRGRKPVGDVEVYDPASDDWTRLADLATPRSWIGAVTLNGAIHLLGGVGESWNQQSTSFEVYSPGK